LFFGFAVGLTVKRRVILDSRAKLQWYSCGPKTF